MRRTIRANTVPINILSKIELHHEIGVVHTHSSLEVERVGDVNSVGDDHVLLGSSSRAPRQLGPKRVGKVVALGLAVTL